MKVYGLAGKKQCGKNTFADFASEVLFRYGVSAKGIALADALKHFCVEYLYPDKSKFFGNDFDKNKWIGTWKDFFVTELAIKYNKKPDDNISGREVLQVVGTDIFRANFGQDFWTNLLERKLIESSNKNIVFFITDIRFPNEIDMVKSLGGKIIKIYRNIKRENTIEHISETALDSLPDNTYDYIVDAKQNSSMEKLRSAVMQFLYTEGFLDTGILLKEN